MEKTNKKKTRYFPSPFLIIIGLIVTIVLISWVGSAASDTIKHVGILDTFSAIFHGFKDKIDVIIFIFSIGGLLGIMTKIKAIDAGISVVVKKIGSKILLLIPILMFIFGLGGTTFGMWEETIAFIPVIVLVFKKTVYGPLVGLLVVLFGAGIGCLASTINPFAIGVIATNIPGHTDVSSITPGTRWLSFVVFEVVGISSVIYFAKKIKSKKVVITGLDNELIERKFTTVEEIEFTVKRKVSLGLFIFTFILMIILYLPWNSWIAGIATPTQSFFSHYFWWFATANVDKTGEVSGAGFATLGAWSMLSVASLFLITTIVIFIINVHDFRTKEHNPEQGFLKTYMEGISDVMSVCLVIAVAGGLGVVLQETNIGTVIANQLSKVANGWILYGIGVFVLSLILSFFVPSSSGFATAFMPIFCLVGKNLFPHQIDAAIGIATLGFIFANGIVNLISPTSAALMGYTTYVGIPYNVWIKYTWKMILALVITALVIIILFSFMAMKGSALF